MIFSFIEPTSQTFSIHIPENTKYFPGVLDIQFRCQYIGKFPSFPPRHLVDGLKIIIQDLSVSK